MTVRPPEAAAFAGVFLFGVVIALLGAVLPLVSEPLGLGLDAAGNLFLVLNAVMLAGTLAFGMVVDRFGYRGVLFSGPLLVGLSLLLVVRADGPVALAGAIAVLGLGGCALNGATNALVADLHVDPRTKGAALNRLGIFFAFGALFLPLLIGTMLDRVGLAFLLYGIAGVCVAVGMLSALPRYPPAKQPEGLSPRDAVAVLKHPLVALLCLLLFFQAGSEMLLAGYLTTYLTRETGATVRAASWVLTGYWLALVAARAVLGRVLLAVPGLHLVPLMCSVSAAAVALVAVAPGFVSTAALFLLAAFAMSGVIPTVLGVASAAVPEKTGTVFGLLFSASLMGAMTVPWIAGHMAEVVGLRVVLAFGCAGFVVSAFLSLRARRLSEATTD